MIDTDSAFLTVLGKRLEGAGWEHRVLAGSVPVEELVAMKLNALLVDLSVLGPAGLGVPRAGLRDDPRPRRARLHLAVDRRPARPRACGSAPTTGSASPATRRR